VAPDIPPFSELIAATAISAVHLEMRDAYTPDDQRFIEWLAGKGQPEQVNPQWSALVRAHTARGVRFRRARIVSEPLGDYIRFEHAMTVPVNVAAGEQVRWLPRRRASDLCLPGNDFWVFDSKVVRLHYFAGNGDWIEDELSHDPALVKHCAAAFEAVWERAIDHADYVPLT
jgi:hypothetical protein